MNNGGQIRPPFFNNIPNMMPQPQPPQPPSPFHPNIPPPNFSMPPPTISPGAHFPRFSGPMHNQPTFNPAAGGNHNVVPPALPGMNLPPVYNVGHNINNNNNIGVGNQGPVFNQRTAGQWSNSLVNNGQHIFPTNQQRQMPNLGNDIFSDAPKNIQCGFPNFKPTIPPPLQNSIPPSPMPPGMQQRGGMAGRGGGRGGGFHQGNNGFHNNNNNNHSNNKGKNNNSYNNNYNNNGRGGFRGGMNNRGRGNFHNKDQGGNNSNNHHDGNQKKKEPKVDRRDLPENNVFYCDTCDRGFKNEEKYKEHVDEHQKCSYKDCPFVAAPKLVQLHMNMQHRQGLASKIYGVKSEEDIKKWRDERRKNYPTADNIKKKKEKQEERIGRGEIIETKEFGKMRGQNRGRGRDRGRGRGRDRFGRDRGYRNFNDRIDKEVINVDEDEDGPPEERKIERSRNEDENDLTTGTHSDDDDDENLGQKKEKKKTVMDLTTQSPPTKKSKKDDHSISLVSGYGSDSDESGDKDVDGKAAGKTSTKKPEHNEDGGNRFGLVSGTKDDSSDDDDHNTDVESVPKRKGVQEKGVNRKDDCDNASSVPISTTTTTSSTQVKSGTSGVNCAPEVKNVKRGHGNKGGPPDKKPKFTPRPLPKSHTLLEKLLAKEIRRERNKILQCIHFIVKNKFFEKTADD